MIFGILLEFDSTLPMADNTSPDGSSGSTVRATKPAWLQLQLMHTSLSLTRPVGVTK